MLAAEEDGVKKDAIWIGLVVGSLASLIGGLGLLLIERATEGDGSDASGSAAAVVDGPSPSGVPTTLATTGVQPTAATTVAPTTTAAPPTTTAAPATTIAPAVRDSNEGQELREVYLAELDPVDSNRLSKRGAIRIAGALYSRSPYFTICQSQGGSPANYTYLAGKQYTRFEAHIGLAEGAQSRQHAELSVLIDGTVAWEKVLTPGEVEHVVLDIPNAVHVSLQAVHVEPAGALCSVAHLYDAGFGDARFLP